MNAQVKKKFKKQLIDLDIFTQTELARRLNITTGYLSLIISGERTPRDLQIAIARIVEMDPRKLWR